MESGQKLYTTVHAGAAWKIPDRLAGQGIAIPREVLGTPGNLNLLMYQALLPTNCKGCAIRLVDLVHGTDSQAAGYFRQYGERLRRLYGINLDGVCVRNPQGCEACSKPDMPELNGLKGRSAVCEMIEPDEEYSELVSKADGIGVVRYLQSLRGDNPFDSPVMAGKSALECAIYKATQGEIDPREIEQRFMSFERIEAQRRKQKVSSGARSVGA
jgi:type II secretory ATPase GspE/PulE/Tfp pilus assembly ATPase PilB-like protein